MLDFRKLQKQPEIHDKTIKKVFGKFKFQTTDSLDKYKFVTLGAKPYAYTKNKEVFFYKFGNFKKSFTQKCFY